MKLILASTGSYPRSGDTPELQVLEHTLAAAARGEKSTFDVADAENFMTRRAVEEQVAAGVELLTDGQVRWRDPVSHLPGMLDGVELGAEMDFFGTGWKFHAPHLRKRPERRAGQPLLLAEEYKFACNALGSISTPGDKAGRLAIKPVLTGPYTLAKLSSGEGGEMASLEGRAEGFAEVASAELKGLAEAGAHMAQVDEPALLHHPGDWRIFAAVWERVAAARQSKSRGAKNLQLILHLYSADAAPLYDQLAQLSLDVLSLDFTVSPRLADAVSAAGSPLPLGIGCVSGASAEPQEVSAAARLVEKLLPKLSGPFAQLCPSCGLGMLPRRVAFARLEMLRQIRDAVLG